MVTDALPADVAGTSGDGAARLPGEWALQVPNDYRDVLRHAVPAAIADAGINPVAVVGVATDFTACTMVPVRAIEADRHAPKDGAHSRDAIQRRCYGDQHGAGRLLWLTLLWWRLMGPCGKIVILERRTIQTFEVTADA